MEFLPCYFEEETRYGYAVSPMRKRSWAAQLEVLQVVTNICERNGLQYFAEGGTLLGTVRHHGFIPWDDDVDVCLLRKEYSELIRILPKELPKGFYVRGIHSENPTGIEATDSLYQIYVVAERPHWNRNEFMKYFHGYPYEYVGVDIWPIDIVPFDHEEFEIQKALLRSAYQLYWNWEGMIREGMLERSLASFEEVAGVSIPKENPRCYLVKLMDSIISLYSMEKGEYVQSLGNSTENFPVSRKECYDDVIYMPFENIEMPVPVGYDEILTNVYGNWHKYVDDGKEHGADMEQKLKAELEEAGFSGGVEEFCEKVLTGEITCV